MKNTEYINFNGVSFNKTVIVKDMHKDPRFAHVWSDEKDRAKWFNELYNLMYANKQQPIDSTAENGHTAGADKRSL